MLPQCILLYTIPGSMYMPVYSGVLLGGYDVTSATRRLYTRSCFERTMLIVGPIKRTDRLAGRQADRRQSSYNKW